MQATIITIGDEILIGQVIDSNSAYIANALTEIGVRVTEILSVSDTNESITTSLNNYVGSSDLIVMTGGLGPTNDDITKKAILEFFNVGYTRNETVLNHIIELFNGKNSLLKEVNYAQADVPENCEVLFNNNGTAPGMLIKDKGSILVSMPGVPFEMRGIVDDELIPWLKTNITLPRRLNKTFLTTGVPESVMSERLQDFESSLPPNLSLAYLPAPGLLRLRLSAFEVTSKNLNLTFDDYSQKLKNKLGNDLFGFDNEKLAEVVIKLLKSMNATMACAESCTGGSISRELTSIPGASEVFQGGIIAYSNKIKQQLLGVKTNDLERYGAVSEQVVKQMAEGVRKLMGTTYGIATSGIAGPGGGTVEKPVGTVWISVSSPQNTFAQKFNMGKHRGRTVIRSTIAAINMLRTQLMGFVEKNG